MKKLIIYNMCLARGGAERVSVYLADHLVKQGIACDIVTETKWENEYNVPDGVARICLTQEKKISLIKKILKLRHVIKEHGADTVLIMGVSNCILVIPACLGLGVKVVVSERNDPKNFVGKKAVKLLSRFLMKFADGFVFQTSDAKTFYDKKLHGRGCVIFNPLFTVNLPDMCGVEREKNIVSAGRLVPQKNQKALIEAFYIFSKKYPDYTLKIYGEGPLRGELEAQVKEFGLKNKVILPGNVSDLLERTKDASMFVMSSNFEGMPNALIEAMAIGLPCISTDCPCGGPKELIEDKENGILIPVGDVGAMATAMIELVENNELAKKMGKNAQQVRNRLDCNLIGNQWIDYLEKL